MMCCVPVLAGIGLLLWRVDEQTLRHQQGRFDKSAAFLPNTDKYVVSIAARVC
jgi:hypothetical protein